MPIGFEDTFGDLLPTGAFVLTGIRILSYISEDGKSRYRFRWIGDGAVTEMIGLLEMVKIEIANRAIDPGTLD